MVHSRTALRTHIRMTYGQNVEVHRHPADRNCLLVKGLPIERVTEEDKVLYKCLVQPRNTIVFCLSTNSPERVYVRAKTIPARLSTCYKFLAEQAIFVTASKLVVDDYDRPLNIRPLDYFKAFQMQPINEELWVERKLDKNQWKVFKIESERLKGVSTGKNPVAVKGEYTYILVENRRSKSARKKYEARVKALHRATCRITALTCQLVEGTLKDISILEETVKVAQHQYANATEGGLLEEDCWEEVR